MNKSTLQISLVAAVLAAPALAAAQPVQQARCTNDSLDPTQAIARLEWARKCGLTLNTGATPNTGNPTNWFDTPKTFDFSRGIDPSTGLPFGAREYRENTTVKAYSGNAYNYDVNWSYIYGRYTIQSNVTEVQETSGPTRDFWKWVQTTQRPRPLYPSFGTLVNGLGVQLYPHPTIVDCKLYTKDTVTGAFTQTNGDFYVSFYCESSCYTPDQSLRFSKGDVNIVDAMHARRDDLVTLSPDATLDDIVTQTSRVFSYTAEVSDALHVIYKITTASGGSLSVTNEHPVITSEGRLVQAQKLTESDELLLADGTPDPITHIEKTTHFGRVYNIKPVPTEPVANILIAQGYLVGSARFQNDDVGYVNRILLFRAVPNEIMPE